MDLDGELLWRIEDLEQKIECIIYIKKVFSPPPPSILYLDKVYGNPETSAMK